MTASGSDWLRKALCRAAHRALWSKAACGGLLGLALGFFTSKLYGKLHFGQMLNSVSYDS